MSFAESDPTTLNQTQGLSFWISTISSNPQGTEAQTLSIFRNRARSSGICASVDPMPTASSPQQSLPIEGRSTYRVSAHPLATLPQQQT
jgi:hypothetical protein